MVNGKDIFNVHWPNSLGLIEGFCTVCEQPWVDLNPRPFAQKATTLTTAPRRPHPDLMDSVKVEVSACHTLVAFSETESFPFIAYQCFGEVRT